MKATQSIPVLLALNAALVAAVLWLRPPAGPSSDAADDAAPGIAGSGSGPGSSPAGSSSASKEGPRPFRYRELLSTDLRRYVAQLRGVECPETTVQDIILAEVDRRYRSREAALGLHRQHQMPWEPMPVGGGRNWAKWNQLRELRQEKQALVRDLLGIDIPLDLPDWSLEGDANFEAALSLIPAEKRQAARELLEKHRDRRRELQERTGGHFLAEDAEEYLKDVRERRKELETLLGKETFETFEMAASQTGISLRNRFEGFELTDAERRAIFRSQLEADELQVPGVVLGRNAEQSEEADRRTQAAGLRAQQELAGIRAAMSPERQAEFDRIQNPQYRMVLRQVQQANLPNDVAVRVFDLSGQLRSEFAAAAGQAPGLTPQQRLERLQQVQQAAEQRLREALGDEAFQRLGGLSRIPGIPRTPLDPSLRARYGLPTTP